MGLALLKLISSHLLASAIIQPRGWMPGKAGSNYSFWRVLAGAATYAAISSLLVALGGPSSAVRLPWFLWVIGTSAIFRLVLDALSIRYMSRCWLGFLAVQAVELAAICSLVCWFGNAGWISHSLLRILDSPRTYGFVAVYTVSLWAGGVVVRLVTNSLTATEEERPGIEGAGSTIGILERLLVTSIVVFWPKLDATAIGLIFSAKSIARFPEMGREDGTRFAEYYLVGTLTSFAVAIGAGMLARTYLLGR